MLRDETESLGPLRERFIFTGRFREWNGRCGFEFRERLILMHRWSSISNLGRRRNRHDGKHDRRPYNRSGSRMLWSQRGDRCGSRSCGRQYRGHARGYCGDNDRGRARGTAPLILWKPAKASAADVGDFRAELTQEKGSLGTVHGTEMTVQLMRTHEIGPTRQSKLRP